MPDLPANFGSYRVLDRIGSGSSAEVYRARHTGIGGFQRTFAIKAIRPDRVGDRALERRFEGEANVGGKLSHANIVQIIDPGREAGRIYIVKEYVAGPDLAQVLELCATRGISLPVPHAVTILVEVLKGLEYAHNRQVKQGERTVNLQLVHGDLCPAHVILSRQGEVKLTNFGGARAATGDRPGHLDYQAPEQAIGGAPTQQSDLFSAGVVLYEMLTGEHPFRRRTDAHTRAAIHRAAPPPPSQVNPDVPAALDAIVAQALQAAPADRVASATALKESLDRFFVEAGFRFTPSALANFLDQLTDAPVGGGPGVALSERAEDPPTGATDHAETRLRRFPEPPPRQAPPQHQMLSNLEDMAARSRRQAAGDDSTLIRRNPLLDGPEAWGDAPTRLRPAPGATDDELELPDPEIAEPPRPSTPPPVAKPPPPAAKTTAKTTAKPRRPAARSPAPEPTRAPPPSPRRSPLTPLLWLVAGAVVTVMVLAVGVLLGLAAADLRDATRADLELHAPTGAVVLRDGEPLPDASTHALPRAPDGAIDVVLEDGSRTHIRISDGVIQTVRIIPPTDRAPE